MSSNEKKALLKCGLKKCSKEGANLVKMKDELVKLVKLKKTGKISKTGLKTELDKMMKTSDKYAKCLIQKCPKERKALEKKSK